jgi:hypothetical protein
MLTSFDICTVGQKPILIQYINGCKILAIFYLLLCFGVELLALGRVLGGVIQGV